MCTGHLEIPIKSYHECCQKPKLTQSIGPELINTAEMLLIVKAVTNLIK